MMSGNFRAVVTATAAAGIGVTTFTPRPLFDITVAAIAVVVAAGWVDILPESGRRLPTTGILLTVAFASAGLVRYTQSIAWLGPILAGSLIAIFVAQMFRKERTALVDQAAGHLTGAVVVSSGAGWLAVDSGATGSALTLSASVTLAAAAIATALPLKSQISVWLAILLATLAGLGLGYGLAEITLLSGALIGLAAGMVVAAVHYLFGEYSDSLGALPSLSGALIAVAVAGVPVYMLGRFLLHMP